MCMYGTHILSQKETHKAEDQKHAFCLLESIFILFWEIADVSLDTLLLALCFKPGVLW